LLAAIVILLFGCAQTNESAGNGKLKVVASFYLMYDFAKNVGGDRVELTTLIPPGVSPHEFEPTPSAIRQLSDADVFIMNGAGMESWVPNLLEGVSNEKLLVVDTSSGIPLVSSQDSDVTGSDPHIWLDPVLAKRQVIAIKEALVKADPAGKEYYEQNAAAYEAKLDSLDSKIRAEMATCRKKDILITHATLAYFCKEYGCTQIPIEGVSEEGEPSPAELAKIIDQARAQNVTAVYFENLISPRSSQTIASEINGQVLMFNTVHGVTPEEQALGENYISLMEENLANIKKGLDCG
jgi:zinc transport system substrate-binding protein